MQHDMQKLKTMKYPQLIDLLRGLSDQDKIKLMEAQNFTDQDMLFKWIACEPEVFFSWLDIPIVDERDNILGNDKFVLNRPQKRLLKQIMGIIGDYAECGTGFEKTSFTIVKTRQIGFTTFLCALQVYLAFIDLFWGVNSVKPLSLPTDEKARQIFAEKICNFADSAVSVQGSEVRLVDLFGVTITKKNTDLIVLERSGVSVRLENNCYRPDAKFRGGNYNSTIIDEASDCPMTDQFTTAVVPAIHGSSLFFINGTAKPLTSPDLSRYPSSPNILKEFSDKPLFKNHHVFFSPWYENDNYELNDDVALEMTSYIANEYLSKYNLHHITDFETGEKMPMPKRKLNFINKAFIEVARGNPTTLDNEYPPTLEAAFNSVQSSVFFPIWIKNAGLTSFDVATQEVGKHLILQVGIDVGGTGGEGADKTIMCVNYENRYFRFYDFSVNQQRKGYEDHYNVAMTILEMLATDSRIVGHKIQSINVDNTGVGGELCGILEAESRRANKVPVKGVQFGKVRADDYSYVHEYSKQNRRYANGRDLLIDNLVQVFHKASSHWIEDDKGNIVAGKLGIDFLSVESVRFNVLQRSLEVITLRSNDPVKYTDSHDLRAILKVSADHLSAMMCSVAYDFSKIVSHTSLAREFYEKQKAVIISNDIYNDPTFF